MEESFVLVSSVTWFAPPSRRALGAEGDVGFERGGTGSWIFLARGDATRVEEPGAGSERRGFLGR